MSLLVRAEVYKQTTMSIHPNNGGTKTGNVLPQLEGDQRIFILGGSLEDRSKAAPESTALEDLKRELAQFDDAKTANDRTREEGLAKEIARTTALRPPGISTEAWEKHVEECYAKKVDWANRNLAAAKAREVETTERRAKYGPHFHACCKEFSRTQQRLNELRALRQIPGADSEALYQQELVAYEEHREALRLLRGASNDFTGPEERFFWGYGPKAPEPPKPRPLSPKEPITQEQALRHLRPFLFLTWVLKIAAAAAIFWIILLAINAVFR